MFRRNHPLCFLIIALIHAKIIRDSSFHEEYTTFPHIGYFRKVRREDVFLLSIYLDGNILRNTCIDFFVWDGL
ncbi:hypothetical protein RB195_021672 [Necator americanus]|uniref:Secreted protein n=1 Tax=Necator americanus TaxID=51031 RepID=A0ABR1EC57_NECAM